MKDKLTSKEFQEAIKTGELNVSDGKLVSGTPYLNSKSKKLRKPTPEMDRELILENIKEYKKQGKIYIPYDVRSSKNSKVIRYHSLDISVQAKEYKALSMRWWNLQTPLWKKFTENKKYPFEIGFYWIRGSKQKWDYSNLLQMPQDIMVELGWLVDDDVYHLKPIINGFQIDKPNRGLVISIY